MRTACDTDGQRQLLQKWRILDGDSRQFAAVFQNRDDVFFGRFATHAAVIWRNIRRRQCSRESSIAYYDDSVIDKRIHDTHCLQECALSSFSLATAGAEATGSKEEVLDELVLRQKEFLRQKELILDSKSGSKGKKAEKAERAKKSLIWDVEN